MTEEGLLQSNVIRDAKTLGYVHFHVYDSLLVPEGLP